MKAPILPRSKMRDRARLEIVKTYCAHRASAAFRGAQFPITAFVKRYNAGKSEVVGWARKTIPRVHRHSLSAWLKIVRHAGTGGLVYEWGQHRLGQGMIDLSQGLKPAINEILKERPTITAREVLAELRHKHGYEGELSMRTLQRYLATLR